MAKYHELNMETREKIRRNIEKFAHRCDRPFTIGEAARAATCNLDHAEVALEELSNIFNEVRKASDEERKRYNLPEKTVAYTVIKVAIQKAYD